MTGTTTRFLEPAEWYAGAAASTEHRYAVTEEHRRPNRWFRCSLFILGGVRKQMWFRGS